MTLAATAPHVRPLAARRALARALAVAPALLLCAAVGIEALALAAWLPETLRHWFHPQQAGFGDFPVFYRQGQTFYLNATYSPGLAVVMRPLAQLSMAHAFFVYTAANVAALFGIAFLAQASVRSLPARAALALGVLALPQSHWALRVGHFTPVLALALLGGLLLAKRRPLLAGLLLAALALKPQYILVPLCYLAWTRNWRALAACIGGLAALGLAGVAGAVLLMGTRVIAYTGHYYAAAVPAVLHHVTVGQQDQLYVQGWQYSWYGFLVSAGIEPNPLLAFDLILLSGGVMAFAWWKCTPSVARAAAVLGMLLMLPHETFYNWTILPVAAVLLLRSDLRPRWLVAAAIGGLALAAVATQNATPFPLPVDLYRPPGTRGFFWLQPATLAALLAITIAGRRRSPGVPSRDAVTPAPRALAAAPVAIAPVRVRAAGAVMFGCVAVAAGYLGAAYASNNAPFHSPPFFSRATVLRAVPADFPLPAGARIDAAGAGTRLPYRVEWDAPAPSSEVAGIMRARLADGSWTIIDASAGASGDLRLRTARARDAAGAPVLADVEVLPRGAGSRVLLEFSPLPASSVPNYDRWLQSIGVVVHNVPPGTPPPAAR